MENTFSHRTILVIDQYNASAERFYGLHEAFRTLPRVVMESADSVPGAKVVVRLHPAQKALGYWEAYRHRVEISQGVPLHDDLARATVAVGLFSGALTVACASGVPTFFLWKPGWFYTPDLACFASCFVDGEQLAGSLSFGLQSIHHYESLSHEAREGASRYYHTLNASVPELAGYRIMQSLHTVAGA